MEHKIKYKTGVYELFNLHTHQHIHPPVHNANRGRQTRILSAAKILANFLSIAIFFFSLFIIQNGAKGLRTVCSVKISDGSQRWRPLHAEPLTSRPLNPSSSSSDTARRWLCLDLPCWENGKGGGQQSRWRNKSDPLHTPTQATCQRRMDDKPQPSYLCLLQDDDKRWTTTGSPP